MKKVKVVVLGDIGRSPRMQYHALSFANDGFLVNIVGYKGSSPLSELIEKDNVKFDYIIDCPQFNIYLPNILAYVFKTVWQAITLLLALIVGGLADGLLVQNPPAIPSLGVCWLFCRMTRTKFVIDWHNYGYTILGLSIGADHSLVTICRSFEFGFGRKSDANLCVTRAMKDDLLNQHGISAVTFYDRPPDRFKSLSLSERHDMFRKLGDVYELMKRNCNENDTIFTTSDSHGVVSLREDRPGLLISSTSWTEDEDFSILLDALQEYEESRIVGQAIPPLLVVITGKGPLKQFYLEVIARRSWKHVNVITPWLTAEDYPKFLACGDLGVSLHFSSSGLDLPMKVVDMFGCGVPVCAAKFNCISELVKHKENGLVFERPTELAEQIKDWFRGFPVKENSWQSSIRSNVEEFRKLGWDENWVLNVKPIFNLPSVADRAKCFCNVAQHPKIPKNECQ